MPTQAPSHDPFSPMGGAHGPANTQLLNELQSEVSSEATPLLQFILKHAILIMICLALFVVILGGIGGYNWYTERNLQQAQAELSNIVLSKQGEERITALEAFLSKAPSSLSGGIYLAISEAAMEIKSYDKAAANFGSLANLDPQGALGLLAGLNQGQALLLAQKPKEALVVLEAIVNKVTGPQKIVIQQSLAEAAIQSGDMEKAKKTFEEMGATSQGPEGRFFRYLARTVGTAKPSQENNSPSDKAAQGDPNQAP